MEGARPGTNNKTHPAENLSIDVDKIIFKAVFLLRAVFCEHGKLAHVTFAADCRFQAATKCMVIWSRRFCCVFEAYFYA